VEPLFQEQWRDNAGILWWKNEKFTETVTQEEEKH
jgi:hypothetical protein